MTTAETFSILIAAFGSFSQIAIGAYYYGKLSQKADGHEARILNLESDNKNHSERITRLESTVERRREIR